MTMLFIAFALAGGLILLLLLGRRAQLDEHSDAYRRYMSSPVWRQRARRCLDFTHRRCCLFPFLRAVEAHHMHYRNFEGELVVRDIVPLSRLGHRIVHAWILWRGPGRPLANALCSCATLAVAVLVRPLLALVLAVVLIGLVIGAISCWDAWWQDLQTIPGWPVVDAVLREIRQALTL